MNIKAMEKQRKTIKIKKFRDIKLNSPFSFLTNFWVCTIVGFGCKGMYGKDEFKIYCSAKYWVKRKI